MDRQRHTLHLKFIRALQDSGSGFQSDNPILHYGTQGRGVRMLRCPLRARRTVRLNQNTSLHERRLKTGAIHQISGLEGRDHSVRYGSRDNLTECAPDDRMHGACPVVFRIGTR
jgi:phage gpG-like protein